MSAGKVTDPRSAAKGRWRALAGVVAVVLGLGVGGAGQAQAAPARPLLTGITSVDSTESVAYQQAKATGVQFVRIEVPWSEVAPRKEPSEWAPEDPADPNYNWAAIDSAVTAAAQAGLTPVIMVDRAPRWAQLCRAPAADPGSVCDPAPGALAAFATAAARRYSGSFQGLPRVGYWQGLNEPNLSLYFDPQFEGGRPLSPKLYRALINAFYFAVKAVDPSNLVLAAGLGPIAVPRLTIGPMRFARELLCMSGRQDPHPTPGSCGGGVHFDIFDIHPYTTGGPAHEGGIDDVELGDLPKLQTLLRAADRAGRIKGRFRQTPLWITEFSWDSNPPNPAGLAMPILTRWTAEALYRAWSAGVSNFFWLGLRDNPIDPNLPHPATESIEAGLYFRGATVAEDRSKEVMYAFRFPFVAYSDKGGFSFWGRTPTSTAGRVSIQVSEGAHWRAAAAAEANAYGIFRGVAKTSYGRGERGNVRAAYRGETAVPFSLHPVREFYQRPFG